MTNSTHEVLRVHAVHVETISLGTDQQAAAVGGVPALDENDVALEKRGGVPVRLHPHLVGRTEQGGEPVHLERKLERKLQIDALLGIVCVCTTSRRDL